MKYAFYYHEDIIADFPVYGIKIFEFPDANLVHRKSIGVSLLGAHTFAKGSFFLFSRFAKSFFRLV